MLVQHRAEGTRMNLIKRGALWTGGGNTQGHNGYKIERANLEDPFLGKGVEMPVKALSQTAGETGQKTAEETIIVERTGAPL